MDILTAFISPFLGGLTGLAGTWLKLRHDDAQGERELHKLRLQYDQELMLQKSQQDHLDRTAALDAASKKALADITAMTAADHRASEDLGASFEHDRATYFTPQATGLAANLLLFVDFCRGMVRPGVTAWLNVLLGVLTWWVMSMWAERQLTLDNAKVFDLGNRVIDTVTYLGTTVTTWWFGVRNTGKAGKI